MNRASIKFKFLVAMFFTTFVALVVSSTAMVVYNLHNYRVSTSADLLAQIRLLGRAVTPALEFDDATSANSYLALLESQPKVLAAAIYNKDGELFAGYNIVPETMNNSALTRKADKIYVDDNALVAHQRIVANDEVLGTVFVKMTYPLYEKLQGNIAISIGGITIALLIAFMVSLNLQRSIIVPLHSITKLARQLIDTRDYSLRAYKTGDGEIAYLIEAFNEMLDEVEQRKKALEISNAELGNEINERKLTEESLKRSEENVLQLNAELEQRVIERTLQLEVANKELEAFSYSVSHDLRTPLRAIDGFSQALLEDYNDRLDDEGRDYLNRVRGAAQRMGNLIDDMLKLSRVSRAEINLQTVNLSDLVDRTIAEYRESDSKREVAVSITPNLHAQCDPHLIKIAISNLIGNAWKYSTKKPLIEIEFGVLQCNGKKEFFVRDHGVGFDMAYADKLFGAFQRLHNANDFPGTGIGLATVKRVITRHGGEVRAEAVPEQGATFYFTLPVQES